MVVQSLCVFCASSDRLEPRYYDLAAGMGAAMARAGLRLVYGGGGVGMMGALARAVLAGGGSALGILPDLLRHELCPELAEVVVTADLFERKRLMLERSDAFLALPGGVGTLDELLEMLVLKQLGYHDKPIVLLNMEGFYDPLLDMFGRLEERGFAYRSFNDLFQTAADPAGVVDALERPAGVSA